MWKDSPEVVSVRKSENGNVDVLVRFVNAGFGDRLVGFGVSSEEKLKELIIEQAKTWDDAISHSVKLGIVDLSAPIIPTTDPTAEELARTAFIASYVLINRFKRAVDVGLITEDDKSFVDALADAKSKFKSEYVNLLF